MTFDQTDLSDDVLDALDAMHFSECTPVQEQAIPIILEGDDLLAVAQTGTGKTAAYLLPIIDSILRDGLPQNRINCLVLVPTRELAMQIDQQLQGFSYYTQVSATAIYGGTDGKVYAQQEGALRGGVDIAIATPGRLLAHLAMGKIDLSQVSFLVLDEADRMLDMGFYDDIMQIVGRTDASRRQTMLFSATMPAAIEKLAGAILKEPRKIKLAVSKPPETIRQMACICNDRQKMHVLLRVLGREDLGKTIVFAGSKLKVREMARDMRRAGLRVAEMHSDLQQSQREETMRAFKGGHVNILVATDIVARGIDIDDVELVVNYDVPREAEDYVHRVGRTARASRTGTALTLVNGKDSVAFRRIEAFLEKTLERMPASEHGESQTEGSDSQERPRRDNAGGRGRRDRGGRQRASKPREQASPDRQKAEEAPGEATPAQDAKPRRRNRRRGPRKPPQTPQNPQTPQTPQSPQ